MSDLAILALMAVMLPIEISIISIAFDIAGILKEIKRRGRAKDERVDKR